MAYEFYLEVNNTDLALSKLRVAARKAMEEIAIEGERNAKKEATSLIYNAPPAKSGYIRTGRLRNAITHDSTDDTAFIGCNVEYAPYVELGTSKMKARPFLKNGIMKYKDKYEEILKKNLENA